MIRFLDKEVEWVDRKLDSKVHDILKWQRTAEILLSVPGVGTGVAYTLLGELPELGTLSNKKIAALRRLSTLQQRQRQDEWRTQNSWRQSSDQNRSLDGYAICHPTQPVMKVFYSKLVAQGKYKKVAITA